MSKSPLLLTFLVIFIVIHTKAQLLAPVCKDEFPNCDRWLAQCFDDVGMEVVCKRSCGFCGNEEQTEDLTQYIPSGRIFDDSRNISPELRARRRRPKPKPRPFKKPGGSSNKNTGGSPNGNTDGSSSITRTLAEAGAGGAAEGVAASAVDRILYGGDDESGDETGLTYGGGDQYVTESGEPCVATKGVPATCGKHGYDYVWCWTSSWDITGYGWSKCKRNINPSSRRLRPSRPSRPINPNTGGSSSNIIDSIVEGVVGGVEDSVGDWLLWNGASDDDASGRKYGGRDGFYLDREMD